MTYYSDDTNHSVPTKCWVCPDKSNVTHSAGTITCLSPVNLSRYPAKAPSRFHSSPLGSTAFNVYARIVVKRTSRIMDQYLTCMGADALSDFRRQELISKSGLGIVDVRASYVHFVALHAGHRQDVLSDAQKQQLEQLLGPASSPDAALDGENIETVFITPRQGISPWSSKATSIAEVCGLSKVIKRIERGTIFTIKCGQHYNPKLTYKALHDPMTQRLSHSMPDLEGMFAEGSPAPLETIDLKAVNAAPQEALQKANRDLGLALDDSEIEYLVKAYAADGPLARSPTDVELFMFAQVYISALDALILLLMSDRSIRNTADTSSSMLLGPLMERKDSTVSSI